MEKDFLDKVSHLHLYTHEFLCLAANSKKRVPLLQSAYQLDFTIRKRHESMNGFSVPKSQRIEYVLYDVDFYNGMPCGNA